MTETDNQTLVYLLCATLALLIFLIFVTWSIARSLAKIERRLASIQPQAQNDSTPLSVAETSPGGAFEAFLNEVPDMKKLPKSDQFAAYRKWRQEKGLNWTGS